MMQHDLIGALTSLARRLVALAVRDEGLRGDLRTLAEAVLEATELPAATRMQESDRCADDDEQELRRPDLPLTVGSEPEVMLSEESESEIMPLVPEAVHEVVALPVLTLGKSRPYEPDFTVGFNPTTHKVATSDADLPVIEARCRLKAEGMRWAVTRHRMKDEGADFRVEIAPRDREILDRAGDIGCHLWMSTPEFVVPKDPASPEEAAGCFDAVADGIALIRGMLPDMEANREFLEPALDILAEAQSSLRVSIKRIGGPNDPDQYRAYDWLRGIAAREHIFIRRHMRMDEPADPTTLPKIEAKIEALDAKFQDVRKRSKKKKLVVSRLRYHAKLIGKGNVGEHDWRKVAGAIDELIGEGVPPSIVEFREILLPILDDLPDLADLPRGFGLVMREIDRYLAGRTPRQESPVVEVPTAAVAEATRLLAGKSVLLIGGIRRPKAHEALKAALGLKDLVWFETREHESLEVFEPYVVRPEVALVLLAIRWSSHSYGDLKLFCDLHRKPMVRLPGGYGVNQVAAQIVAQCSGQLGGG